MALPFTRRFAIQVRQFNSPVDQRFGTDFFDCALGEKKLGATEVASITCKCIDLLVRPSTVTCRSIGPRYNRLPGPIALREGGNRE